MQFSRLTAAWWGPPKQFETEQGDRLGLFTIIIFGELALGVVNGISAGAGTGSPNWVNFALSISLVFALWWIFFTMVSRRQVRPGMVTASLLELLYIPALLALGVIAATFVSLFDPQHDGYPVQSVFSCAVMVFLLVISVMIGMLEYPDTFRTIKRPIRISLLLAAGAFLLAGALGLHLGVWHFLVLVGGLLLGEILYLNSVYFMMLAKEGEGQQEAGGAAGAGA